MIRRFVKKLNNNEGASLMVALLFFVVCATVGSIVITAAMTASGRMTGIKKNSEDYYNLSSAAKVFEVNLVPGELSMSKNGDGIVIARDDTADLNDSVSTNNTFLAERDLMAVQLFQSGNSSPVSKTFFITVNDHTDIDEVKAEAVMQPNYNLEITLFEDDAETVNKNKVLMVFKANRSTNDAGEVKVVWGTPGIYVGGSLR